jgi:hypothetical protein
VLDHAKLGATHVCHNTHSSCITESKLFMNQKSEQWKDIHTSWNYQEAVDRFIV